MKITSSEVTLYSVGTMSNIGIPIMLCLSNHFLPSFSYNLQIFICVLIYCLFSALICKLHVLVSLGCYHRIPWAGWLIHNRNLFLTGLEAGKPKIKAPAYSVWWEPTSRFIDGHLLAVSSHSGRGKRVPWGHFYKGTNPIHQGSTLMT